jgi:hypothetical protein
MATDLLYKIEKINDELMQVHEHMMAEWMEREKLINDDIQFERREMQNKFNEILCLRWSDQTIKLWNKGKKETLSKGKRALYQKILSLMFGMNILISEKGKESYI